MKQEMTGRQWHGMTTCKSYAPRPTQITMPAPHNYAHKNASGISLDKTDGQVLVNYHNTAATETRTETSKATKQSRRLWREKQNKTGNVTKAQHNCHRINTVSSSKRLACYRELHMNKYSPKKTSQPLWHHPTTVSDRNPAKIVQMWHAQVLECMKASLVEGWVTVHSEDTLTPAFWQSFSRWTWVSRFHWVSSSTCSRREPLRISGMARCSSHHPSGSVNTLSSLPAENMSMQFQGIQSTHFLGANTLFGSRQLFVRHQPLAGHVHLASTQLIFQLQSLGIRSLQTFLQQPLWLFWLLAHSINLSTRCIRTGINHGRFTNN